MPIYDTSVAYCIWQCNTMNTLHGYLSNICVKRWCNRQKDYQTCMFDALNVWSFSQVRPPFVKHSIQVLGCMSLQFYLHGAIKCMLVQDQFLHHSIRLQKLRSPEWTPYVIFRRSVTQSLTLARVLSLP